MKTVTAACDLPPRIAVRIVAERLTRMVSSVLGLTISDEVCASESRSRFLPAPPTSIKTVIVEVVGTE